MNRITYREVSLKDVGLFRELLNNPEIKKNTWLQLPASVDSDTILHYIFKNSIKRYILENLDGVAVGTFSFHLEGNAFASGGIFLLEEFRGKGYGKSAFAIRELILKENGVRFLRNEIFLDNTASVANNLRSGAREFGWWTKRITFTNEELMSFTSLTTNTLLGRMELAPFCSEDLPFYRQLFLEDDVQFQTYSECDLHTASDEDAIRFLMASSERRWTVWLNSSSRKEPVGTCHLYDVDRPVANFGMLIAANYRGKKLGLPLLQLLEKGAINEGIKILRADVFFYSKEAISIMEKDGFRQFGFYEKFIAS